MNIDVYVHEYQYAFLGEYLDTLIIRHKFEDADIKIVERDRTTDTDKCKAQAKYTGRDRHIHRQIDGEESGQTNSLTRK